MKTLRLSVAVMLLTAIPIGMAAGADSGGTGLPLVAGILGLSPVGSTTYVAVFVPLAEGQALSGIRWYNNDGLVAFPRVMLAAGVAQEPAQAADATLLQEQVQGLSSDWSEVSLSEPIGTAAAGLYVLFQLPEGSVCHGEGAGTGAGIGYTTEGGLAGWMTGDGEIWIGLRDGFRLAVQAEVVTGDKSMRVLSQTKPAPVAPVYVTALLPSGPNPFNPRTAIRFSLREAGPASLVIYNTRGQVVRRLTAQEYSVGEHTMTWDGRDDRGQNAASGVYLARFVAEKVVMTRRLTLVR
jgi:hypothetical protein